MENTGKRNTSMKLRPAQALVGLAAIATVAVAGCGGGDTPGEAGSGTSTPTSATTVANNEASASPTPVRTPGALSKPSDAPLPTGPAQEAGESDQGSDPQGWSSEPTQSQPAAQTNLLASDFRVGLHPGFYRVVVEFEGGGNPGWRTAWVDQAVGLASGAPLPIKPGKHLDVVIEGTRMPVIKGDPEKFYSGPADKWLDDDTVAWFDTAFEGQTHLAVSVPSERGYRVFALQNPVRLVIDIARQ